ncbi:Gp30 [Mycolicibacterium canariasense]|uniref:Gp30 n=1 Tax=Mycolicibacterium canariasense TaxID=228230 RepID=A0A117I9Z2_MYCCR|nr:DNA cytosine methyltransferase [Mycolicibacterium canariasense]MCV7212639.1 DNA cytosine methyltransferase [Mycolicibacterium canariasense]ORV02523.1 hypothetical protein AWB94_00865 [Mycolicibacterium canariasense]GAS95495.1 Gp30 [Mycolicibacterium canariasense]
MKPLLLDLFCGAGGAAAGYHRAGFDVVGVDINPQPNYPFTFIQGDASHFLSAWCRGSLIAAHQLPFAAVHASPPCQRYSAMSKCRPEIANKYPDLVDPVRELLLETGLPYVIENVPGAPLRNPVMLCGQMFGQELYRHRLFESNVPITAPQHPKHVIPASKAGHWKPGTIMSISGHVSPIAKAREVMGIEWMSREELAESIPPSYTQWVGKQLLRAVELAA